MACGPALRPGQIKQRRPTGEGDWGARAQGLLPASLHSGVTRKGHWEKRMDMCEDASEGTQSHLGKVPGQRQSPSPQGDRVRGPLPAGGFVLWAGPGPPPPSENSGLHPWGGSHITPNTRHHKHFLPNLSGTLQGGPQPSRYRWGGGL